jgi:hypothetical protein
VFVKYKIDANLVFMKYKLVPNLCLEKTKFIFQINFNWDIFGKITLKYALLKKKKKKGLFFVPPL